MGKSNLLVHCASEQSCVHNISLLHIGHVTTSCIMLILTYLRRKSHENKSRLRSQKPAQSVVSSGTRPPASLRQSPPLRWFDDARIARNFRVPSLAPSHVSSHPTIRGMFNGGLRDCAEDFSPNSVVALFAVCFLLQLMQASPLHDGNL